MKRRRITLVSKRKVFWGGVGPHKQNPNGFFGFHVGASGSCYGVEKLRAKKTKRLEAP